MTTASLFPLSFPSRVIGRRQASSTAYPMKEIEEVGMDVDDADSLEMLEGTAVLDNKPADSDFFNAFEDDFDDSDIF